MYKPPPSEILYGFDLGFAVLKNRSVWGDMAVQKIPTTPTIIPTKIPTINLTARDQQRTPANEKSTQAAVF
jgi:hypothetical protein